MESQVEKMYENAGIKPEYRYDCKVADTIKPVEVFPLHSCSKGEIKDFCTSKQYYRYCKVYKVNKIYPPFTAEKQLFLFQWVCKKFEEIYISYTDFEEVKSWEIVYKISVHRNSFEECLCAFINLFWQSLTEEEKQQIRGILE